MNIWDELTKVLGMHRHERIPGRPKRGMGADELKVRTAYRVERSARNKAASGMRAIQRRYDRGNSKRQRGGR